MVPLFFVVEKAYDTLWKEGLLIEMHLNGTGEKMFNNVVEFLDGRIIGKFAVHNYKWDLARVYLII